MYFDTSVIKVYHCIVRFKTIQGLYTGNYTSLIKSDPLFVKLIFQCKKPTEAAAATSPETAVINIRPQL